MQSARKSRVSTLLCQSRFAGFHSNSSFILQRNSKHNLLPDMVNMYLISLNTEKLEDLDDTTSVSWRVLLDVCLVTQTICAYYSRPYKR